MEKSVHEDHLHQNFCSSARDHFSVKKLPVFRFYYVIEFQSEDPLHDKQFVRAERSEHFRKVQPVPLGRAEIFDEFLVI